MKFLSDFYFSLYCAAHCRSQSPAATSAKATRTIGRCRFRIWFQFKISARSCQILAGWLFAQVDVTSWKEFEEIQTLPNGNSGVSCTNRADLISQNIWLRDKSSTEYTNVAVNMPKAIE